MPGSVIVDATIGAPPAWASQHERETETDARGTPGDPFLYITVKADGDGPAAVRPYWEAELLGGALLDELHSHGHRPLSSVQIAVRLPDGTTREVGGGIGNVVSGQQFSTASDQSIADRIRSGAAAAGLTVRSIKFVHPLQAAPVVVLQTTDVAGFAERSYQTQTFEQILGDFTNYEGWYLEVDDTDGAPVTIVTGVGRLGTGQRWVRPGLPTIDNRSYGP
jgi:hypothetical protein